MSDGRDQWPDPPPLPGMEPPLWFVIGLGSILILAFIGMCAVIVAEMLNVPFCG